WLVWAAILGGRGGLHVPGVDLTGPAVQAQEDTRLRLRATDSAGAGRAGAQELGQAQAEHADAAHLQQLAPAELAIHRPFSFQITCRILSPRVSGMGRPSASWISWSGLTPRQ